MSKLADLLARNISVVFAASFLIFGCGGGGGGGGGGVGAVPVGAPQISAVRRVSLSTDGAVDAVVVAANQSMSFNSRSAFPGDGPFIDVSVNVPDTVALVTVLPGIQLQVAGDGPPAIPPGSKAHVTIRIGQAGATDTCENGYLIASFDMPLDGTAAEINGVPANEQTVNLVNTGQYTVCTEVTPSVSIRLTIPSIEFDVTECENGPADFSGEWEGPYSCTDICDGEDVGDFGGIGTEFVEQDGTNARYTDESGFFSGTVCGNEFHFSGGYGCDGNLTCSEIESGIFTLVSANSGTKTSHWDNQFCNGDCEDTLQRVNKTRRSGAYDVDFEDADWTVQLLEKSLAGSTVTAESKPGAYRKNDLAAAEFATAKVFNRSVERSHNPATQGMIDQIKVSWKTRSKTPNVGFARERPAVYQQQADGSIKIFELDSKLAVTTSEEWKDVDFGILFDGDFHTPGGEEHPNFHHGIGGQIWFGYVVELEHFGKIAEESVRHDMDDFSVIVYLGDGG